MALAIGLNPGHIKDFRTFLTYLRESLDWPLDLADVDELTFDYEPEELELDEEYRVKIRQIKHLRPFSTNQPWGIFWIDFENRQLPVVVMRRILRALVPKRRVSARASDRAVWNLRDLLFMSALGESGYRRITFSHFREVPDATPMLETFSWDDRETHFYYLERLHLERLHWPADTSDVEGWRRQWAGAFTSAYREPVRTSQDLSMRLAALAARTRDLTLQVLKYEREDGPLHGLLEAFQRVLIHDLTPEGFADTAAQTIAYGLFSARCTGEPVGGLARLSAMVPNTNRFLKDLFAQLAALSGHRKGQLDFDDLGLSEMVRLLQNTNIEASSRISAGNPVAARKIPLSTSMKLSLGSMTGIKKCSAEFSTRPSRWSRSSFAPCTKSCRRTSVLLMVLPTSRHGARWPGACRVWSFPKRLSPTTPSSKFLIRRPGPERFWKRSWTLSTPR
jgi:hypothetical protein